MIDVHTQSFYAIYLDLFYKFRTMTSFQIATGFIEY